MKLPQTLKSKSFIIVLLVLVAVVGTFIILRIKSISSISTAQCISTYKELYTSEDKVKTFNSNLSKSYREKFKSAQDFYKSDYSTESNSTALDRIEYTGKDYLNGTLFICPHQGDNKFPFGCNGYGYEFVNEDGGCKLNDINQYFD